MCIKIAGLCHDLGHGPFSHFFDGVFIPRAKPNSKWQHEQASCDLFDFMLQSNPSVGAGFQEYDLGKEEIDFIKELIIGLLCDVNNYMNWVAILRGGVTVSPNFLLQHRKPSRHLINEKVLINSI